MASTVATSTVNLGFLTILQEASGYLGGYLVTNQWGRPLEFRLSTAVQPNRVQKILYAGTLEPYICADLIGKTLVEKTGIAVQLVITDTAAALDLRHKLEVPVAWVAHAEQVAEATTGDGNSAARLSPCPLLPVRHNIHCHGQFPADVELIQQMLERLIGTVDLSEPFSRIREAMGEARKMGVGSRGLAA